MYTIFDSLVDVLPVFLVYMNTSFLSIFFITRFFVGLLFFLNHFSLNWFILIWWNIFSWIIFLWLFEKFDENLKKQTFLTKFSKNKMKKKKTTFRRRLAIGSVTVLALTSPLIFLFFKLYYTTKMATKIIS